MEKLSTFVAHAAFTVACGVLVYSTLKYFDTVNMNNLAMQSIVDGSLYSDSKELYKQSLLRRKI